MSTLLRTGQFGPLNARAKTERTKSLLARRGLRTVMCKVRSGGGEVAGVYAA
jgi:hypothetical protein